MPMIAKFYSTGRGRFPMRDPNDRDDDRWREGPCVRCGAMSEALSGFGMCPACDPGFLAGRPPAPWVQEVLTKLTHDLRLALEVERMIQARSLPVVCCVCGAHLSGPRLVEGQPVSHGYCQGCLPKEVMRG